VSSQTSQLALRLQPHRKPGFFFDGREQRHFPHDGAPHPKQKQAPQRHTMLSQPVSLQMTTRQLGQAWQAASAQASKSPEETLEGGREDSDM